MRSALSMLWQGIVSHACRAISKLYRNFKLKGKFNTYERNIGSVCALISGYAFIIVRFAPFGNRATKLSLLSSLHRSQLLPYIQASTGATHPLCSATTIAEILITGSSRPLFLIRCVWQLILFYSTLLAKRDLLY